MQLLTLCLLMSRFKYFISALVVACAFGVATSALIVRPVFADSVAAIVDCSTPDAGCSNKESVCVGSGGVWEPHGSETGTCKSSDNRTVMGTLQQIMNIMLFIAGAVAIIMIIVGGIRYTISAGDQSATTAAKNTIMYAVIGLVIVIAAYAIINFVLGALFSSPR